MYKLMYACIMGLAVLFAGCQAPQARSISPSAIKQSNVNGVTLPYLDQGQGAPVVFVHGAFADHRIWEAQREAIAKRYRYIALDQRYFGKNPWPDNGANYSLATHTADLAGFIRELKAGPVHVVGWSYGGSIVLALAVQHPDLVRSVFVNEPALASIVTDPADQKVLGDERKELAPAVAAAKAGDHAQATRLFAEWVNARPGGFDAIPSTMRAVHLENGRTIPPHFGAPPPAPITCAQLGNIKAPVAVTKGQQTRPFFRILADATGRCIPGSEVLTIPNARHLAPYENAAAFNDALLAFLARQKKIGVRHQKPSLRRSFWRN
jgi:pimeloyl-ACP methyl ester carboxylesterase